MNDVTLNKVASIQRSVKRAKEEYKNSGPEFATDYTHQDAAILNILRACETALDLANHLIRKEGLGLANSSRESFALLVQAKVIPTNLGLKLEKMIAFRNIAVHEYAKLDIKMVESILHSGLEDLLAFSKILAQRA